MPNPADVPADMMADYLQKLFKVADSNDDGVLSPIEFAELLSRSGFNFPDHVILSLVKAADVNEDGVIEYEEFVPAMLGLMEAANEDDHTPDVGEGVPMWDEVPADMLERYLEKLFQIGDTNGDGVLQPQEFLELLTRAGLRFPANLVLKLFLEADTNGDGVIEYDEFMPAMLDVIAAMKGESEALNQNDQGAPVAPGTDRACTNIYYCGRYLGRAQIPGSDGHCGPNNGPQCASCRRYQPANQRLVNDEGAPMRFGTDAMYSGRDCRRVYYCGRYLGRAQIPGSDGHCGPNNGPQCASCRRYQPAN